MLLLYFWIIKKQFKNVNMKKLLFVLAFGVFFSFSSQAQEATPVSAMSKEAVSKEVKAECNHADKKAACCATADKKAGCEPGCTKTCCADKKDKK